MRLHMPRLTTILLLLAVLPVLGSCEHSGPFEADTEGATLENIQQTIFNPSCAVSGCHIGGSAPLGLDLSEGAARDNLVGVASEGLPSFKRVDPGNPDDSYLVMKLEGDSRIAGQQMPLGRPALSSDQIALVREWIASLRSE